MRVGDAPVLTSFSVEGTKPESDPRRPGHKLRTPPKLKRGGHAAGDCLYSTSFLCNINADHRNYRRHGPSRRILVKPLDGPRLRTTLVSPITCERKEVSWIALRLCSTHLSAAKCVF